MSSSLPIATNAAMVTPEWLTAALGSGIDLAGRAVVGYDAQAVGTGQMGENVRFVLQWNDGPGGDLPATVVAKFPSDDPVSRATGLATRSYEREVAFYREVADTVDIRTPRCFYADVDLASGDFVLILEDLAPRQQGDQLRGCSIAEAEVVIDQLVALQAPRWNDPSLNNIDWLSRRDQASVDATSGLYRMVLPGFAAQIGPLMDAEHVAVAQALGETIDRWMNIPDGPATVTHGDYRLDNMLFDDAVGLAVVDWQGPGHGSPWHDLAYFMGTGLLPEVRASCEADIVQRYVRGLNRVGVDVGFDEAWLGYRRASYAGVLMAVVASQIVVATDRGNKMFAAMADRSAAMALHHHATDLI